MVKAAVVGGGIFGCTIAVDLARADIQVDLFEAQSDILTGTTDRCQARLHRGYHYPRSDSTAQAARDSFDQFQGRYPEAVYTRQHHYLVAEGSAVAPEQYLEFCDRLDLPYEVIARPPAVLKSINLTIRVPEAFVDVAVLRRLLSTDLRQAGVSVHCGRQMMDVDGYDLTVWATYGQRWPRPLRYEVCEVALVELGRYIGDSFVVVDGPFVSLDPIRGRYALYDVKHSVHHANVGMAPEIPDEYKAVLDGKAWPREAQALSRFDQMVESASRFLWGLNPGGMGVCIYHRSMWSVRAVLPDVDSTDERPTLIERDGNNLFVLSGKIGTAVQAANQVTELALSMVPA